MNGALALVVGVVVLAAVFIYAASLKTGKFNLGTSAASPSSGLGNIIGGSSPSPSQEPGASPISGETNVILTKDGFQPNSVTIKVGTKVIWQNQTDQDATVNSNNHPTHLLYPPLNLGKFSKGQTLSLVFDKPGTFGYHNHLNPSQEGQIVVEE